MNIALISESPTVTTGFGVNARHLLRVLAEQGHQTTVFAVCGQGQPGDLAGEGYRLAPMPRDQREAIEHIPAFLRDERPDLLFVHYDLGAAGRFIAACRAAGWDGPIMAHVVLDGLPFSRRAVELLATARATITVTRAAGEYLRGRGVPRVLVAPHPLDRATFRPLPERDALRRGAGLDGRFLVGVFARNTERKQQPRVMQALALLRREYGAEDILLYLHCQPRDEDPWMQCWDLAEVAEELGIADRVWFPPAGFRQLGGTPYAPPARALAAEPGGAPGFPARYGYLDRLNCCDMVVNVPYNGAFELSAIEAQACGVPAAITDDGGPLAEVVGQSALLLPPADVGIHGTGARQYFVAPRAIAEAIWRVKTDAALRAELAERGFANAARYTYEPLRAALAQAIALCMG